MTDDERKAAAQERYTAAAHAMQTGVAAGMIPGARHAETEPKHLRVGVNSALVSVGALAALLVRKGVITEVEYFEAMADGMEAEAKRYADELSERFGTQVTLG